jgi:hypothetical protein
MNTVEEIFAAINPLPAMLAAKGKTKPNVKIEFEANCSRTVVWMRWQKEYKPSYHGEEEMRGAFGDDPADAVRKAVAIIDKMPSAANAKLQAFMRDLGKLIDIGKDSGITVDYLNPLTETMKRLSENIITYQPDPDDIPF